MLSFLLPEPSYPHFEKKLEFDQPILLFGSCFSDNIGSLLLQRKASVLSNPLGILYDPISIATCVDRIATKALLRVDDLILTRDLYKCWALHSSFSSVDAQALLDEVNASILHSHEFLSSSSVVVITLGSAYAYYNIKEENYVANCHKMPASLFSKQLLSITQITKALVSIKSSIHKLNSKARLVFTVSPVRHIKDGLIENNRSKAHLIAAIQDFVSTTDSSLYFPSYELAMDVLRDYRFFKPDMVHPNETAIDYIFQRFVDNFYTDSAKSIFQKMQDISLACHHKPLHPKSNEYKVFVNNTLQLIEAQEATYSHLNFEVERGLLRSMID